MSPTHPPLCVIVQSDDGTYTGFIKVHLKLRRPVTVPAGIRPQSIYDALKEVNLADTTDRRTSFYLPLDAIKQLHISSTTTVSEVIQGLLKKFMVVDNPQKFALFKEMRKDGQGESVEPHAERFRLEKASEIPKPNPSHSAHCPCASVPHPPPGDSCCADNCVHKWKLLRSFMGSLQIPALCVISSPKNLTCRSRRGDCKAFCILRG